MGYYFNDLDAVFSASHGDTEHSLSVLAGRYIGANPESPYTARPFTTEGIIRNKDYRYEFDGNAFFPGTEDGKYAYAWGKIRRDACGSLRFLLIPKGPVKIWANGTEVYATTFESERFDDNPVTIDIPVEKGWNHIVLRFTKTRAGFGAEFGTWLGKLDYYFLHGTDENNNMEGFDIVPPTSVRFQDYPPSEKSYEDGGFSKSVLPLKNWSDEESRLGNVGRIFKGTGAEGKRIAARSRFTSYAPGEIEIRAGDAEIYVDGTKAENGKASLKAGIHQVLAILKAGADGKADFSCDVLDRNGKKLPLENPLIACDEKYPWMFAGPFAKTPDSSLADFKTDALVGDGDEKTWWRIDIPGGFIRLYNENPLWGHWDYPLGVTLYGLIETGRMQIKNGKGDAIARYVENHVRKTVSTLEYALFDRDHFGGATCVHHLLSSIDSLDDCGSFGSLLLEVAKDRDVGDYGAIADYVGDYITKKQARLEDGSFWRKQMMHKFHNGTMWADDLYMSVPFLCRYAAFKNDGNILDDAARQFLGFKKRLYMADKKLMAHVFDFRRNMNTGVPWGRGNGWTIFSLSELLQVLPENHKNRGELLSFFRELSEGYLSVQDESGMFHQVLDMPESYPESSCTSMFICAFSRGIRNGWFEGDTSKYRESAMRAWAALEKCAIDKAGNLYGVCRGSEFSFNPKYYSEHLLPQLNNTHGIGITLLAGVEILKLAEFA